MFGQPRGAGELLSGQAAIGGDLWSQYGALDDTPMAAPTNEAIQLGYLNAGWDNPVTKRILGMGGAIPFQGQLGKLGTWAVNNYNEKHGNAIDDALYNYAVQNGVAFSGADGTDNWGAMQQALADNANAAAFAQNNQRMSDYWNNRSDLDINWMDPNRQFRPGADFYAPSWGQGWGGGDGNMNSNLLNQYLGWSTSRW